MWVNHYVYVPKEVSHLENQFLDRFVPDPFREGEWIDSVMAERMCSYYEHKISLKARAAEAEAALQAEAAMPLHETDLTDPYSGQKLYSKAGQLLTEDQLWRKYGLTASSLPFSLKPDRNKQVSQQVYDWFDRGNCYIQTDRDYEIRDMASIYVDGQMYDKGRTHESLNH